MSSIHLIPARQLRTTIFSNAFRSASLVCRCARTALPDGTEMGFGGVDVYETASNSRATVGTVDSVLQLPNNDSAL